MTDEEKKTRRARRSSRTEGSEGAPEQPKDRNLRLRDEAARRRQSRKREREAAQAVGLDTRERVDDALSRTAKATTKFVEKNFSWLQWVFLASIAGLIAYFVWDYRTKRQNEKAADALMLAVSDEQARVAGVGEWHSADPNLVDPRPEFGSNDERLKAAEQKYRDALGMKATASTRLLAHVGLGGVLYDQGKYAAARAEYDAVRQDKASALVPEALARALEGIGLAYEAEGNRPEALKAFEALGEKQGYGNLAAYHRARVLHAQGENPKALELLKKVREDLSKQSKPGEPPSYLQAATDELMRIIDPRSVPKQSAGQSITPEQLEELKRQMEELQRRAAEAPEQPAPMAPEPEPTPESAPTPAPEAPKEPVAPREAAPTAPAPKAPAPAPQAPTPSPAPQAPTPQAPTPAPQAPAPAPQAPEAPQAPAP